jgi:hypothetical protein
VKRLVVVLGLLLLRRLRLTAYYPNPAAGATFSEHATAGRHSR